MIKTEQFMQPCQCVAAPCTCNSDAQRKALSALVDAFAADMKAKLWRKAAEGYQGWDELECREGIAASLARHVAKGVDARNMVDVANLAAMLWNFQQPGAGV